MKHKTKKRIFSATSGLLFVLLFFNMGSALPDAVVLFEKDSIRAVCEFPFIAQQPEKVAVSAEKGSEQQVEVSLFGVIPVKTIAVSRVSGDALVPGGFPFGVKLFTQGVMVVGMSAIETEKGSVNPALVAGIRQSDIILSAEGEAVNSIEELSEKIHAYGGDSLSLRVKRNSEEFDARLSPVKCKTDGLYKVGMWVRDSTAGIGTVTFYRPADGKFGGLGHGICDVDTGDLMPFRNGTVVRATIIDVKKGRKGTPGELVGIFDETAVLGQLTGNSNTGIYGILNNPNALQPGQALEIVAGHEVRCGKAQILSCVAGGAVEAYDIIIEHVYKNSGYSPKNMVIKVTDPRLLQKTGGIVQGMSGSPILQNGKLVGAVTHVLVNDPTSGFGIFIENMIDELEKAS